MMVSRGIAFTKSLGLESRALMNGISGSYKKKHGRILFLRKKKEERRWPSNQKESSHQYLLSP